LHEKESHFVDPGRAGGGGTADPVDPAAGARQQPAGGGRAALGQPADEGAGRAGLFRLPQQPDGLAVVQLRCAGVVAGVQRYGARPGEVEFLGVVDQPTAQGERGGQGDPGGRDAPGDLPADAPPGAFERSRETAVDHGADQLAEIETRTLETIVLETTPPERMAGFIRSSKRIPKKPGTIPPRHRDFV